METKLNLIKNLSENNQKSTVVLPNFPFCYLAFKGNSSDHTYEVTDISYTGMQISLKNGEHDYSGNELQGEVHWHGESLKISAEVKWKTSNRMGLEFFQDSEQQKKINDFLSLERITKNMRAIHKMDIPLEFPVSLKYWLRADGPLELFIWSYDHGDISKFQFLLMEHYIEWTDGQGLKTGKLFSKRDLDTPLLNEDEFTFIMDQQLDQSRLDFALQLLSCLPEQKLSSEVLEFLNLKLRH